MPFLAQIIVLVLLAPSYSACMQTSAPIPVETEIPISIKTKYDEEKSKFTQYNLDRPERFLEKLRKQLKKDTDLIAYLKSLQTLASRLLLQAIIIQQSAYETYLQKHYKDLVAQSEKLLAELGAKKIDISYFEIFPENGNEDDLAELLAHSRILKPTMYSPEQLRVIFSWIIDPSKSSLIHKFGLNRKAVHEGNETKKLRKIYEDAIDDLANPTLEAKLVEHIGDEPKIITENLDYFIRFFKNQKTYHNKLRKFSAFGKGESIPFAIMDSFDEENVKNTTLYNYTFRWYQKLYSVIRQELFITYAELIKKNPTDISLKDYLMPLPRSLIEKNVLPKIFPKELPEFKKPSEAIMLTSLDKQLEQARAVWASTQKQKVEQERTKKTTPSAPPMIKDVQETDKQIIIQNPKNRTTEIIFKTDQPFQIKQLPPLHYTDWVKMWFDNPHQALKAQGYTTFGTIKYEYPENRERAIARHAFSPKIDEYIKEWGTNSEVESRRVKGKKDILITMPGLIKYPGGTSETGVYTYIIDSANGQWYHRMFTKESGNQLIEDLTSKGYFSPVMTGYYDVFFPPLPGK